MFITFRFIKGKLLIIAILSFAAFIAYYLTAFFDHLVKHDHACYSIASEIGQMMLTKEVLSELEMEDIVVFLIEGKEIKGEINEEQMPLDYAGNPYHIMIEGTVVTVAVEPSFYYPFSFQRNYDWEYEALLEGFD